MCVLALTSLFKLICLIPIQFILLHTKGTLGNIKTLRLTSNTSLSCNYDLQVLSLQTMFAVRHDTKCGDINEYNDISSDTVDDIKDKCDDKTSCMVDRALILDREPHLKRLGYYNLFYKCAAQTVILKECDFDDGWCNLEKDGDGKKFLWKRKSIDQMNLPSSDNTHPTSNSEGYFAYVSHRKKPTKNAVATITIGIESPFMKQKCLTFWFFKSDTEHSLKVYDGNYTIETLTKVYNTWTKILVDLEAKHYHTIIFKVSYNDKDLQGYIALDNLLIVDSTCGELERKQDQCVSLRDSLITTCAKPEELYIEFSPEVIECYETYSNINELLFEKCEDSTSVQRCSLDIYDEIKAYPECFLMNEIFINFTCIQTTTSLTVSDSPSTTALTDYTTHSSQLVNPSSTFPRGATIGVAAGVLCIAIAIIAILVVRRKKIRKTIQGMKRISSTNNYIGHQSIALPEQRSSGYTKFDVNFDKSIYDQTYDNFKDGDYDYATSGNGQIQNGTTMDSLVSNDKRQDYASQSDGMYFELEKMSDLYEMAKPDVDTDDAYVITDTEYAISGHDYHKNNETNVYSHSKEDMYDSSTLTRKESPDDDNYDHFVGEKTEDDYDITRR